MINHISHILVAEFDIDKGSQLAHQYPEKTEIEEHKLAELMLPDGAHLREEDWTFFILNQHIVEETTLNHSEQQDTFISEGFLKFQPVISANCYIFKDGFWNKIVEYDEIYVQLFQNKIVLFNKTLKCIGEITPEIIYDSEEDINAFSVKIATKTNLYGLRFLNENDYRIALNTIRSLLFQRTSLKPDDVEITKEPLPTISNVNDILYVLNLVRTKQIPGVRRGARVKAIAITSHHQWLHVFKPLLIMALDQYFEKPEVEILEKLYKSMNSLDISLMPLLSYNEKIILRASDDPMLFNERFLEMEAFAKAMKKYNSKSNNGHMKKIDRHFFETNVLYDIGAKNPIKVPIKIPMTMFNGEIGDLSVIQLISTFGNSSSPTKHHPQLDNNVPTNPIIILINALLTQKRVLFLGHLKPSGEVANFVLAACALGSCGILRGYTERCFPYTNLAGLDDLLKVPGYIAGVTNPAFEEHPQWWDVLFNINTGKVTISPNIDKAHPVENRLNLANDKETLTSSFDKEFMIDIMNLIQQKYGEHYIRERFRLYLLRFIEVASEYEKMNYGKTKIGYSNDNIQDKYNLGVGAYFSNEASKRREISYNINRIEGWKQTKSYELYVKDFHNKLLRQTIRTVDVRRQAIVLRYEPSIQIERLNTILKALAENITTDEQVTELLIHFLHNQGGLFPIASSVLHTSESIRINCTKILVRLDYSPIGSRILSHLNPFIKLAYEKSAQKFEKRWGKNWFIISNDSPYPKGIFQMAQNAGENPMATPGTMNNNGVIVNPSRNSSNNSLFSPPDRRKSFSTITEESVDTSKQQYYTSPLLGQRKSSNPLAVKMIIDSYSLPVPPRQVDDNVKVKISSKGPEEIAKLVKSPLSAPNSLKRDNKSPIINTLGYSINRSKSDGKNNYTFSKKPSVNSDRAKKISINRNRPSVSSSVSTDDYSEHRRSRSYDRSDLISSTSESSMDSDYMSRNEDEEDEDPNKSMNQSNDIPYCDVLEDDLINLYNTSKEFSDDSRADMSAELNRLKITNSFNINRRNSDDSMEHKSNNSSYLSDQPEHEDNQHFSPNHPKNYLQENSMVTDSNNNTMLNISFVKRGDDSFISNDNRAYQRENKLNNINVSFINRPDDSFASNGKENKVTPIKESNKNILSPNDSLLKSPTSGNSDGNSNGNISFLGNGNINVSFIGNNSPNPPRKNITNNGLVFTKRSDSFKHPYDEKEINRIIAQRTSTRNDDSSNKNSVNNINNSSNNNSNSNSNININMSNSNISISNSNINKSINNDNSNSINSNSINSNSINNNSINNNSINNNNVIDNDINRNLDDYGQDEKKGKEEEVEKVGERGGEVEAEVNEIGEIEGEGEEEIEGYSHYYENDRMNGNRTVDHTYLDGTYSSIISQTDTDVSITKGKEEESEVQKKGVYNFGQYGNYQGTDVQNPNAAFMNSQLIPDYESKGEDEQLVIPKINIAPTTSTNPVIQRILQKQQQSLNRFNGQ